MTNNHGAAPSPTLKFALLAIGLATGVTKIVLLVADTTTGTDTTTPAFGGCLTIGTVVGLIGGTVAHCRDQILAHITRVAYELHGHGDQLAAEIHGYGDQRAAAAADRAERDTMATFAPLLGGITTQPTQRNARNGTRHMTPVD